MKNIIIAMLAAISSVAMAAPHGHRPDVRPERVEMRGHHHGKKNVKKHRAKKCPKCQPRHRHGFPKHMRRHHRKPAFIIRFN